MTDHGRQLAIEATGAVTEHGISRAASRTICRHCGAPTIRGLDADRLAFDVTVDPTPLDQLGELLALTQARPTYDAVTTTGRIELEPRRPTHIARPRRHPVLAQHRCGQPLPAAATESPTRPKEATDEPPF